MGRRRPQTQRSFRAQPFRRHSAWSWSACSRRLLLDRRAPAMPIPPDHAAVFARAPPAAETGLTARSGQDLARFGQSSIALYTGGGNEHPRGGVARRGFRELREGARAPRSRSRSAPDPWHGLLSARGDQRPRSVTAIFTRAVGDAVLLVLGEGASTKLLRRLALGSSSCCCRRRSLRRRCRGGSRRFAGSSERPRRQDTTRS